jgi:hypothetical protein
LLITIDRPFTGKLSDDRAFFVGALALTFVSQVAGRSLFFSTTAPVLGRSQSGDRSMIDFNNKPEANESDWRSAFLKILPEIQRRLRLAFRNLGPEAREEAIEEGIVHCLLSYARLSGQGKAPSVTPSSLAWYSSRHVKRGRPAVGRMNGKNPLSRYAQLRNRIQLKHVHERWMGMMVEDKRAPVFDQVAAKIDIGAWFATLSRRTKQIAKDLALGDSTCEAARKHGVTAARISQLRRSLEESWAAFQQKAAPAVA